MKNFLVLSLMALFCAVSVHAETGLTVFDVTGMTEEQKKMVSEDLVNAGTPAVIYDSSSGENYSAESSILWNNQFTKDDFVNLMFSYEPTGSYAGTQGWESFYRNNSEEWFEIAINYNINPAFLVAVSCWETGFGNSRLANEDGNLFGLSDFSKADNPNVSIYVFCNVIEDNIMRGERICDVAAWYSADPEWADGIASLMNRMFGSLGCPTLKVAGIEPANITVLVAR